MSLIRRSFLPLAFALEKSGDVRGGSEAHGASKSPIQPSVDDWYVSAVLAEVGKCLSGNRASRCLHLSLTARQPRPADSDFGLRQVDVAAVDGARAVVAGDGWHVQQHVNAELLAILVRAVQVIVLVLIVEEVPNFSTSNARPRPPGCDPAWVRNTVAPLASRLPACQVQFCSC